MQETALRPERSYYRLLFLVLLLAVVVSGSTRWTVHAAVSVPDRIRVALLINTGSATSSSLASAATLSSAGGMTLYWRDPQVSLPVASLAGGQSVRFAMDGYRALLLETTDLKAATAVLKKVQTSSAAAFVTQLTKSGQTVYQVSEGAYATAGAASSALTKWTNAGVASGVQTLLSARVAGPYAVESGPYPSAADAVAAANQIGGAGLDAFVALRPQNGAIAYFVRVGQAADAAGAGALSEAVSAAGGLNVRIPDASEGYAVMRTDATLAGGPATLYAMPASTGVVLRADPAGADGILVTERSKRTYRGSMEMSVYGNYLAVVNDVDLEQYLYSVVGMEVGGSWPAEGQKAQAVAARSYALSGGMAFKIANVVDTTVSQAYNGISSENKNSTAGVDATRGQVLVNANGKVVSALFSSNSGGITADSAEGWGNADPTFASAAPSPDDGPNKGKLQWYRIATKEGLVGYVREDLATDAEEKNAVGKAQVRVTADGATLRQKPTTDSEALARMTIGSLVVPLEKVLEQTTAYSWVEIFTPEQLAATLNKRAGFSGPLYTLEVSGKGPSGRAVEVKANGSRVAIADPDGLRSALGGVRSTLISIDETGRLAILDGEGDVRETPRETGTLSIEGGNGQTRSVSDGNLFVMDGEGNLRAATASPKFIISGKGWGHGVGMSQWGARGMAEQGYDYQKILLYYYKNVTIEKDAA